MEYELRDYNKIICEAEEEEDVHGSTTLLDPSEGEEPTTDNDVVPEAYSASMSSRRSFDESHHSEDDLCVHLMLFSVNVLPMFSWANPQQNAWIVWDYRFSSDQL